MKKLLVKKGKKVVEFKVSDDLSDEDILKNFLGRSGTLRAPVLQSGKTLMAGWEEETYKSLT
ncbi:MAG: hypothetical protein P1V97_29185 [Planctomycetota bacterium]|nr:hypothetical protein [Planctomycetota bacterium]